MLLSHRGRQLAACCAPSVVMAVCRRWTSGEAAAAATTIPNAAPAQSDVKGATARSAAPPPLEVRLDEHLHIQNIVNETAESLKTMKTKELVDLILNYFSGALLSRKLAGPENEKVVLAELMTRTEELSAEDIIKFREVNWPVRVYNAHFPAFHNATRGTV